MERRALNYEPGSLVRARGREWVVLPGSDGDLLKLRPFGGSREDVATLYASLELEPPSSASFPPPNPERAGSHDAARLLRDASVLKLRTGAGPFRSFGNIAVEPRAYQLVPLMMALKQQTARLLIADDVGIGKTIEAGLIVRELFDRGEILRCAVLCPPHLVEQWVGELSRFSIQAEALTSSTASRLERSTVGSIFDRYPFTVISLDYIKSESRKDHFLHMAPECIVVDEAHTCTLKGRGRQRRFELLKGLAEDENRHMILLTATPHSGDDEAFHNLLSLLRKEFIDMTPENQRMRERLSRYFVQRRRKDIEEWRDQNFFPRRMTAEQTYKMSGGWANFFESVRSYCASLAVNAESGERRKSSPLIWFAALALMRCAASSPAAAEKALSAKLSGSYDTVLDEDNAGESEHLIFDGADDLYPTDVEPPAVIEDYAEDPVLKKLISEARWLVDKKLDGTGGDPKLAVLKNHLNGLLKGGFHPVVFCRYIATANYVASKLKDELKAAFPEIEIEAVTGELHPEERMERVEKLAENDFRILVATDCLSEGINLQEFFDSVVHYDLAWNPTRHEQREGRIDRFGQKAPEVRCTMIYGENNPIDGLILKVILRKAEAIRRDLGIMVPLPDNGEKLQEALKTTILKGLRADVGKPQQLSLDFGESADFEVDWQDAIEKMKANRTIFAQKTLKPEDVLPEWQREQQALGGEEDVKNFVLGAAGRLGSNLSTEKNGTYALNTQSFATASVKERLKEYGLTKKTKNTGKYLIDFHNPPSGNADYVHRSHPLVTVLADELLETALSVVSGEPGRDFIVSRCAVTVTKDVDKLTRIYLLRLRHQLTSIRKGKSHPMMAEELLTVAFEGVSPTKDAPVPLESAGQLLDVTPSANVEAPERYIRDALDFWRHTDSFAADLARARAETLREDHMRVKDASNDSGSYEVHPCLPVDLLGVYVLLPDGEVL